MSRFRERIAAAPISWGVWEANEATGWTVDPDTYLTEAGAEILQRNPAGSIHV